jgi:hypothetical protein
VKYPFSAAFGAGLVALILVGCGSASGAGASDFDSDNFNEMHKHLSDGRTVTCLDSLNGYGNSVSCDWEHAK